jgi:hypothetical protein
MDDLDLKKLSQKEARRIKKMLKDGGVPKAKIGMLEPVIQNAAWMKAKLDETMELIENDIVYLGDKENPAFTGYEKLWKSYMQGMNVILAQLPKGAEVKKEEIEKPKTILELVRERHGA